MIALELACDVRRQALPRVLVDRREHAERFAVMRATMTKSWLHTCPVYRDLSLTQEPSLHHRLPRLAASAVSSALHEASPA